MLRPLQPAAQAKPSRAWVKFRSRVFTAAEKTELWDRWQRGESLKATRRAFGKPSSSIYFQVVIRRNSSNSYVALDWRRRSRNAKRYREALRSIDRHARWPGC